MTDSIPTMRALVLNSYTPGHASPVMQEIPVPEPRSGEVRVRILASPINPSDLMFMQGLYGVRKPLPIVPGFEASGEVVAVGEGLVSEYWLGRRVACFAGQGHGPWAEYMVTAASLCFSVPAEVSDEQAATILVNPLSAWALVEGARQAGVKALVQTAAGSALGRMIERLALQKGLQVINVVRRAEQVAELKSAGSAYVLHSGDAAFDSQLRELCRTLDARLAFDAVGGELTGRLLRALPHGGRVTVYGGLALEPCLAPVDQLIFRGKSLDGFWLTDWMRQTSPDAQRAAWSEVQQSISTALRTEIRARYPLEAVEQALADYQSHMSGGKVLFVP